MSKVELQTQMRSSIIYIDRLAWAVDKLPESETRGELIYRYDKALFILGNLQADLDQIDIKACYYSFTDNCPGIPCMECEYVPR